MTELQKLIQYWKDLERTLSYTSKPPPPYRVDETIKHLEELQTLKGEQK